MLKKQTEPQPLVMLFFHLVWQISFLSSIIADINECIEGGHRQCGQLCTNIPGSYFCSCLPDYVLEADKWSCAAQGKLQGAHFDW